MISRLCERMALSLSPESSKAMIDEFAASAVVQLEAFLAGHMHAARTIVARSNEKHRKLLVSQCDLTDHPLRTHRKTFKNGTLTNDQQLSKANHGDKFQNIDLLLRRRAKSISMRGERECYRGRMIPAPKPQARDDTKTIDCQLVLSMRTWSRRAAARLEARAAHIERLLKRQNEVCAYAVSRWASWAKRSKESMRKLKVRVESVGTGRVHLACMARLDLRRIFLEEGTVVMCKAYAERRLKAITLCAWMLLSRNLYSRDICSAIDHSRLFLSKSRKPILRRS